MSPARRRSLQPRCPTAVLGLLLVAALLPAAAASLETQTSATAVTVGVDVRVADFPATTSVDRVDLWLPTSTTPGRDTTQGVFFLEWDDNGSWERRRMGTCSSSFSRGCLQGRSVNSRPRRLGDRLEYHAEMSPARRRSLTEGVLTDQGRRMEFWELASVMQALCGNRDALRRIVVGTRLAVWLEDYDHLVSTRDREILDSEVPEEIVVAAFELLPDRFTMARGALRLALPDSTETLSAIEVHRNFGGSIVEEVLEYGSAPIPGEQDGRPRRGCG